MITIEKTVDSEQINEEIIQLGGRILKQGGLVAFPTETVYGLGANALSEKAAAKIYEAKGRPSDNPLIVHIAELESLYQIAAEIPHEALQLAQAFWPGPLTMIFSKKDIVPDETTGGLGTVAVRMPEHPVALALIRAGGGFIAAPSANISGRPSPTLASHVAEDLIGRVDMIIDGGPVGIGIESTIVDMSGSVPVILRPGIINEKMLTSVIERVDMDQALLCADEHLRPRAPGMKYKHYAPKADLTVVEGEAEAVIQKINCLALGKTGENQKTGIIGTDETVCRYSNGIIKSIGSRADEASIARHLYGILRDFDQTGVTKIYSESFVTPLMGQAIMNRLLKAAGHHIIYV